MIDKRKVIRMTRMAVYDKRHGEEDRKLSEYFRSDYIARKNFATRCFAVAGGIIVLAMFWVHETVIVGVDIFSLDYMAEAIDMGVFLLAVTAVYTVIGTVKGAAEYEKSRKRVKEYLTVMNQLERIKSGEGRHTEKRQEVSDIYYGADIADTRDDR